MLKKASLSSKGQITIPVEIRKMLGIKEGDIVNFSIDGLDNKVLMFKDQANKSKLESYVKIISGLLKCRKKFLIVGQVGIGKTTLMELIKTTLGKDTKNVYFVDPDDNYYDKNEYQEFLNTTTGAIATAINVKEFLEINKLDSDSFEKNVEYLIEFGEERGNFEII